VPAVLGLGNALVLPVDESMFQEFTRLNHPGEFFLGYKKCNPFPGFLRFVSVEMWL
jgi:hypothetical protein